MSRKTRHLAMGLGVVLVWSACFVVISASRGDAPPGLYAGLRALLGGLPLLALAANRRIAFPPSQAWGWILLLAVTNTTIGRGGMFVSVGLAGAALPAVLESSQALLVAPFAAFLFGERLTLGRFAGLLLGLMGVGLMAATWTVPLEEVADPTDTQYVPRPEWYFYFLFELLWKFPGKWIPVATFYIPLGAVLILLLLLFFDRTTGRSPLKRPAATGIATVALAIMAALTYQGATAPAPPREGVAARQETNALPPELAEGRTVYDAQGCSACHVLLGAGSAAGPDLTRVGARRDVAWVKRFMRDPNGARRRARRCRRTIFLRTNSMPWRTIWRR